VVDPAAASTGHGARCNDGGVAELFAWTAGAGTRALCLHGSGGSGEDLLYLAERIPSFLIVAPDRPGYGRSREVIAPSLDAQATLLGRFLDKGAHLFGQSYGGVLCPSPRFLGIGAPRFATRRSSRAGARELLSSSTEN
jgi:pimeloyl-ACP methyl ester carboxylesterase